MTRWGMVIDQARCNGCAACVSACKQENNIPTVGPQQAQNGRTIFWMDIIVTVEGVYPDVRVRYMPRPCFQCDNAPCTKVCPVRATYVNEEGLVAQVYHRCIGCRYCMVACPYTAKSFNWREPSPPDGMREFGNPDVSRRMKGVVEKCSFCSHRLIKAREDADAEQRELREEDYTPACADACPTNAITFGDLDNEKHQVYDLKRSNRAYRLHDGLGTEPKVYYLGLED